jgi:hypothetical protein
MVEDTSKTPAGNKSDAESGEQSAPEVTQSVAEREKEIGAGSHALRRLGKIRPMHRFLTPHPGNTNE